MSEDTISIAVADLSDPDHQEAMVDLIAMYAQEPGGGGKPLPDDIRNVLPTRIQQVPFAHVLLAWDQSYPVGVAVCFEGFSTFRAQPLLNIHDLAVRPEYRGRGVGRQLLTAAESLARQLGGCKLTLEVYAENDRALRVYKAFGFECGNNEGTDSLFMAKTI